MKRKKEKKHNEKLPDFMRDKRLFYVLISAGLLLFAGIVATCLVNIYLGIGLLIVFLILSVILSMSIKSIINGTNEYISELSYRIKRGEQEALIKMPIGILLYNEEKEVQWVNPYLQKIIGNTEVLGRAISDIDDKLDDLINNFGTLTLDTIHWQEKEFQVLVEPDIRALYLMDVTEYAKIAQLYEEEQVVMGHIFIDNFDEIAQGMNDRRISNLNNFVTTQLSSWAREHSIYLKRVTEDRYIVFMYRRTLEVIEAEKFNIIDKIRERTSKQNFPLTLSIGIAYDDIDLRKLSEVAQSNLDLALGRGGDQVVVKSADGEARFYGGKTNPMEKRTRVRARMISQALQELMIQSDQVFVMGHRYPDMDAIGSSLGIRRIAQMNGQNAKIVLNENEVSHDVARLLGEIKKDDSIYSKIIASEVAEEEITPNSLLVLVDVHRPSLTIAPELLAKTKRIVIIDHHRRGGEFPENPVLIYIEPYASSAAELITELFEYQPSESNTINKIEATAMLAGIIVDTKSFSLRTGSRTFDAASYLRSVGADSVMIQKLLKEDVETYLLRSHLIETMELYHEKMAIAVGEEGKSYDTVVAAQTADALLSMASVDASFVITLRSDGRVGISARSLGDTNVQVIMEAMGGGGHLSNAATQLTDVTIAEAKEQLKAVLDEKMEGDS